MRIGVVSDTHIPMRARALPQLLFDAFADVDVILHAGDVAIENVLLDLEALAPVYAVRGNVDPPELWRKLPQRRLLDLAGARIGLIHGDGVSGSTPQRALKAFANDRVDCVVFGHSHTPMCERRNGLLLFNPGSPTDRRRQAQHSYGLLTINDGQVDGEILTF